MKENLLTGKALEDRKREKEIIREESEKDFRATLNRIFSTTDGKMLGEWLIKQCGFLENSVVMGKDGIISSNTVYNEARRSVYLELRRYFDPETLLNIEIKR